MVLHPDGTIDRGIAFRKPKQRQGERLFRRGNTGRNPDTFIEDRRLEGDLTHLDTALQKRSGKLARDRKATRGCTHPRR